MGGHHHRRSWAALRLFLQCAMKSDIRAAYITALVAWLPKASRLSNPVWHVWRDMGHVQDGNQCQNDTTNQGLRWHDIDLQLRVPPCRMASSHASWLMTTHLNPYILHSCAQFIQTIYTENIIYSYTKSYIYTIIITVMQNYLGCSRQVHDELSWTLVVLQKS